MATLQVQINDEMAQLLKEKSKKIGISRTSYVKVLIAKDLELAFDEPGNIFNADRDNKGVGIPIEEFEKMLIDPEEYDYKNASWVQK